MPLQGAGELSGTSIAPNPGLDERRRREASAPTWSLWLGKKDRAFRQEKVIAVNLT